MRRHVRRSLDEDLGDGDVTTALLEASPRVEARLVARETGTLAGRRVAELVLEETLARLDDDAHATWDWAVDDGDLLPTGGPLTILKAPLKSLLSAERVLLNYLQQLSGTATATHRLVQRAEPYEVEIYDTRKTVPHLRRLQKYAVRCGGGHNHRMTLSEAVMIKDNHKRAAGGLGPLLDRLPRDRPVVLEIHNLSELHESGLLDGPTPAIFDIDVVMLDNVDVNDLGVYLTDVPDEVAVEVSGGIGTDNLEAYCEAGIDRVSVGALTHSFRSLDISLQLDS